jgi:hypothetical protein
MKLLEKIRKNSKDKFNKITKKLNIKKNYTITFDKINKEPKLFLVDKKEVKLVGDFNFYGIYNKDNQIWTWANVIPDVLLSQIKYIENLRSKAYIFEKNQDSSETNVFFYQFLTNDSMVIPEKYVGLITDIILYLSDDLCIFEPTNSVNNIQFIGLSKILELHE